MLDYTRDLASFGLHSDCRVEVVKNHRLVLTGSSDGTAKIFRADGQCFWPRYWGHRTSGVIESFSLGLWPCMLPITLVVFSTMLYFFLFCIYPSFLQLRVSGCLATAFLLFHWRSCAWEHLAEVCSPCADMGRPSLPLALLTVA